MKIAQMQMKVLGVLLSQYGPNNQVSLHDFIIID